MLHRWFACFLFCQLAPAATVYSTFGPGDSFATGGGGSGIGWAVGSNAFGLVDYQVAARFTPTQDYLLDAIRISAFQDSGVNEFIIELATEVAGAPGTVLESFPLIGVLGAYDAPAIFTLTSAARPGLTAGVSYFVVMRSLGAGAAGWSMSSPAVAGVLFKNPDPAPLGTGGVWASVPGSNTAPAFSVEGSAVPEPACFALLGGGLLLLALAKAPLRH